MEFKEIGLENYYYSGRAPKNAFFYTDRTIFSCG